MNTNSTNTNTEIRGIVTIEVYTEADKDADEPPLTQFLDEIDTTAIDTECVIGDFNIANVEDKNNQKHINGSVEVELSTTSDGSQSRDLLTGLIAKSGPLVDDTRHVITGAELQNTTP
jgi:hypothetical protein